jgi:hypothetical protein
MIVDDFSAQNIVRRYCCPVCLGAIKSVLGNSTNDIPLYKARIECFNGCELEGKKLLSRSKKKHEEAKRKNQELETKNFVNKVFNINTGSQKDNNCLNDELGL